MAPTAFQELGVTLPADENLGEFGQLLKATKRPAPAALGEIGQFLKATERPAPPTTSPAGGEGRSAFEELGVAPPALGEFGRLLKETQAPAASTTGRSAFEQLGVAPPAALGEIGRMLKATESPAPPTASPAGGVGRSAFEELGAAPPDQTPAAPPIPTTSGFQLRDPSFLDKVSATLGQAKMGTFTALTATLGGLARMVPTRTTQKWADTLGKGRAVLGNYAEPGTAPVDPTVAEVARGAGAILPAFAPFVGVPGMILGGGATAFDEAKAAQPNDPNVWWKAGIGGAAATALTLGAMGKLGKFIPPARSVLGNVLKRTAVEVPGWTAAAMGQQAGENLVARETFDPNRPLGQNVLPAGAGGAITAGIMAPLMALGMPVRPPRMADLARPTLPRFIEGEVAPPITTPPDVAGRVEAPALPPPQLPALAPLMPIPTARRTALGLRAPEGRPLEGEVLPAPAPQPLGEFGRLLEATKPPAGTETGRVAEVEPRKPLPAPSPVVEAAPAAPTRAAGRPTAFQEVAAAQVPKETPRVETATGGPAAAPLGEGAPRAPDAAAAEPVLRVGAKGTYDFGGPEPLPVAIESSRPGRTVPSGRYPQGEPTTIWRGIDQSSGRFFEFYGDQEKLFKPTEPARAEGKPARVSAFDAAAAERFWGQVDAAQPDLAVSPEERADLTTLLSARARAAGKTLAEYLPALVQEVKPGEQMPPAALGPIGQMLKATEPPTAGKRGAVVIEDGRRTLYLMHTADASTFVHEFAHLFRRELPRIDAAIAGRWSGAVKLRGEWQWSRDAEERFARGFERYLAEGKAPTPELAGVFERFRAWLVRLYEGIRGSPLEERLSPGVRRVFDRLLGGEVPARGPETLGQPDLFGRRPFDVQVGRQERLPAGAEAPKPAAPEAGAKGVRRATYHKGDVESAVAATVRLKSEKSKFVYATGEGAVIADTPPPFGQAHIEVLPGGKVVSHAAESGPPPAAAEASPARPDLLGRPTYDVQTGKQKELIAGATAPAEEPLRPRSQRPGALKPLTPAQAAKMERWRAQGEEHGERFFQDKREPGEEKVESAARGHLAALKELEPFLADLAKRPRGSFSASRVGSDAEDALRLVRSAITGEKLAEFGGPIDPLHALKSVEPFLADLVQRPRRAGVSAGDALRGVRSAIAGEKSPARLFQAQRQPGEEVPGGARTRKEAQAEADVEAAAEAERAAEAEVHEPPAEGAPEGEEYAEAGPASLRTRAILSSLKPTEIARAARMAAAPGEPSLATYPSVAKALEGMAGASKIRREAEAKAKELLKGETARVLETPTPLLDFQRGGRISAGKGAEMWAEIRDALEGRPWLRKYFDTKTVGGGGEIDHYMEQALERRWESGWKGETASSFLDQLVREADAAHEAESRGADVAQRLRKLSESVPTEDVQTYKDAADLWEGKVRAEHAARDAVQAAMEPYVLAKGSSDFEATLKKLVAESKAEIERVREESAAELRKAERQYEYDLTATRGQIWSIRRQAMAAAEKRIATAEARQAGMEMMRRAFKAAGMNLPPEVRGKLWRLAEGEGIKTPKDLARAMDRADELLAELQHSEAVQGVNALLKTIRRDARKMPEPYRSEVSAIMHQVDPEWAGGVNWDQINAMRQFADDHPEVPMPRREIDELARLDRQSLRSMNVDQLKTVQNTLAALADLADEARSRMFLEKATRRSEDRQTVLSELAVHKPLPAWKRNLRPESALGRVWLGVKNFFKYGQIDTETLTKPMSARLAAVMVELPALAHNTKEARVLRPFLEGLYAKTHELLGVRFGSPEHRRMWYTPVTVELPEAKNVHDRRVKSITLTAGELEGIHRNLADPDTYQEILEGGLNFKSQPTKGLDRPGPTDPKLMLTGEDLLALKFAGDPKIRALGDWMQARSNEPDFKKAIDEAHYNAKGFHLEMPENRWHRVRARIERPRFEKDFSGNIEALFPESRPSFKARTGTHAAVVIDDPLGTYVQEAHLAARLIGMSEPLRDAYTLLGTPDVQREIVNRFGQKAYDQLVDHLNFVTGSHLTVPGAGEELVRRLMDTASMSILAVNPGPILNQGASLPMFGVYLKPSSMAAGFKAAAHPLESVKEMMANSDAIWLRYNASNVRELLSGPEQSAQSLWRGKFRRASESAIVGADQWTEAFLWEACKAETGGDLQKAARLAEWITDHANQTTNPVYSSGFGREASRQPAYKLVSMFMNAPNRTWNMGVQAYHAVVANPRDPKALAHGAKVAAGIAGSMALLTAIRAGTAYFRSGGRETPTGGSLALDTVGNTLGNAYFVGQAFDAFQEHLLKHRSLDLRQNVAERTTTESLKAVVGLMDAVGQAVEDERYKGGPERGKRRAGDTVLRALESAYRAAGMMSGLPQAPLSYGKGIWRFTHPAAPTATTSTAGRGAAPGKPRTYAEARRALFEKYRGRPAREWWAAVRQLRGTQAGATATKSAHPLHAVPGGPGTYVEARRALFEQFRRRPAKEWWAAVRKLRTEWDAQQNKIRG
jgi:hypothetical protein